MPNTVVEKNQIKYGNKYFSVNINLNTTEVLVIFNNKQFSFSLPQFLFNFKDKNYVCGEVYDYRNSTINIEEGNNFESVDLDFKYKDILSCKLCLKFYLQKPLLEYNFQLTNVTTEEININKFYLSGKKYFVYPQKQFTKFYKSGYQSWSPTYVKNLNENEDYPPLFVEYFLKNVINNMLESSPRKRNKLLLRSENFTVLIGNNINLLIGFTTAEKLISYIDIDNNNLKIQAVSETHNGKLLAGQSLNSENFIIAFADNANDLFNLYADKIKEKLNINLNKEIPVGWCSWYYYYTKVSEKELLKNLKVLEQNQNNIKVKLFQLDDGYQKDIGDWLMINKKFPRGLKALAGTITRAGFTPGIWVAPFIARPTADIFKEHPEWVLKNNAGKNVIAGQNPGWGTQDFGYYYALDLSHPQVLNYLKNVFSTLSEFGFKFFKLDFIFAGCLAGEHYDKTKTNIEIYRNALQVIRDAVGGDSFLLGCGAPLLPSAGLVDGMRIGTDVDPSWQHFSTYLFGQYTLGTYQSMGNAVSRNFYNGKIWINDPECFMLRKTKIQLSNNQKLLLLTLTTLLGGLHLNSDNVSEFGSDEFQLWEKTNPHYKGNVEVINWNVNRYPEQILVDIEKGSLKLVLLNWDKVFTTQQFNIGEKFEHKFHIFDFWNEEYLNLSNGILNVFLPPTCCKVLFLTKASEDFPVIIGNTFHLWQEKVFNISLFSDKKFIIEVNLPTQRKGRIYLQLPAKFQDKNYLIQSNTKIKSYKLNTLLVLEFTTTADTYIKLNFE